MLEIILVLTAIWAILPSMARKPKRRASGRFRAVRLQFNVTIGTLGSGVMLTTSLGIGTGQEYWAISADISYVLENVTVGAGGPLAVGLCHGDYSVTELDEWYEATNNFMGDQIEIEEGRRKCRDVGIMNSIGISGTNQHLNDGRPVRTKLGFRVEDGKTTNVWVRNMGTNAYATTVPILRGYGKLFVRLL